MFRVMVRAKGRAKVRVMGQVMVGGRVGHLLALLVAEAVGADSAARLLLPVLFDLRLLR